MTEPSKRRFFSLPPRYWAALFFASCALALMSSAWQAENAVELDKADKELTHSKQLAATIPRLKREVLESDAARDPRLAKLSDLQFRALLNSTKTSEKKLRAAAVIKRRRLQAAIGKLEEANQAVIGLMALQRRHDALETADLLRGRVHSAALAAAAATALVWCLLLGTSRRPLPAVPEGCFSPRWYWGWRGAWAAFWAALPLVLCAVDPDQYMPADPCGCSFSEPSPPHRYYYFFGAAALLAAAFIPSRTARLFPPPGGERRMGWPWRLIHRFIQGKWRRAATERELLELSGFLNSALRQGLPLNEAFRSYAAGIPTPWRRDLFLTLAGRLEAGAALSAALEAQPDFFPAAFAALMRAGEAQDDVPRALLLAGEGLGKDLELGESEAAVLGHSLLIAAAGLFIALFTTTFILPTFEAIYSSFGAQLPWATVVLIKLCHILKLPLAAAGAAAVLASLYLWRSGASLRGFLFARLAPFSDIRRKVRETRFCRTLARLLLAGCAMDRALELAGSLDSDLGYQRAVKRVLAEVRNGGSLSKGLGASGAFSGSLVWACALGEERGNLPETLLWLGDYTQLSVRAQTERLTPLIERSANVAMGALVGLFLIAAMAPVFSIAGLSVP